MQVIVHATASLAIALAAACGSKAPPPAPPPAPPGPAQVTAESVVAMAADPQGLARFVDPARGLVVVRMLGCERGDGVDQYLHLCGPDLAAEQPTLQEGLGRASREAEGLGSGVTCGTDGRCRIPPTGECAPEYQLVFAGDPDRGAVLVGIVERDDWQHPDNPEVDAEMAQRARRIAAALDAAAGGCGP